MTDLSNISTYLGYPVFVWEGAITLVSTLLAGLLIAFVTTFYLKKKDERTRVAGVILEKHVESQHKILQFVKSNTQKFEVPQPQSALLQQLMLEHGFLLPYDPHIQFADIFSSIEKFRTFFHELEKMLEQNKFWLDVKVRRHLFRMQAYFATINASIVLFNRVPLPEKVVLSNKDFEGLGSQLLFILGAAIDNEFNHLVIELEVLMVRSIYKLDLKRPKTSLLSKYLAGREVKKTEKFLYKKSLFGAYMPMLVPLQINLIEAHKNIEITEEDAVAYYERISTTYVGDKFRSFL